MERQLKQFIIILLSVIIVSSFAYGAVNAYEMIFDGTGTKTIEISSSSSGGSGTATNGFIDFDFTDGKSGTTTDSVDYRTYGIDTSGYEDYHVFYGNTDNFTTWGGIMPQSYASTSDLYCDFAYTATSTETTYPIKIYIKTLDSNENPELVSGWDISNGGTVTSPATANTIGYGRINATNTDYLAPGDSYRIKFLVDGVDTKGQIRFLNKLHCWWQ